MKSLWGPGSRYLRVKRNTIEVSPQLARLIIIGAAIVVVMIFIASDVGLWNLWRAQKTMSMLEQDIERLEAETAYLRNQISELQTNPFAIEKVAREKYGYLRPGDRVYRIITLPMDEESAKMLPRSLDMRGADE